MGDKKNTDCACSNCGAKNPATYTFCFHCNAPRGMKAAKPKPKKAAKAKAKAKK